MRIQTITVDNFKSLVGFRLDLAKFNCLIGLNGSGKSTVLQFVDFLSQQVRGDLTGWLEERKWEAREVRSRLTRKKNIEFAITLVNGKGGTDVSWKASYNPWELRCTSERIETPGAVLEVKDGSYSVLASTAEGKNSKDVKNERILFSYEGSILSQLREGVLPPSLVSFKSYFEKVKSHELLSPEHLRRRTREAAGSLGLGGQKLSAFLYELGPKNCGKLTDRLKQVYPRLNALRVKSLRSGWKQLDIVEEYNHKFRRTELLRTMTTEARHVNDGMLRLIALLAGLQTDHHFVLFDEIENGINPELVEFVLDALVSAEQQVLVTTHSPMVLNYLEDDVAKAGVLYLYKTRHGCTQAIPFFSIPSLEKKLSVMGPGEAFVDTDLIALDDEIAAMTGG
ncbi:MAG: ATP-binding protein [Candidatus Nealsonbacteria bacterium]|nr:ATP-binding protein [Candidatus Nealsonbacteria bacterium]